MWYSMLLFGWFVFASGNTPEVTVEHYDGGNGQYTFFVTNHRAAPYQLSISFSEITNMKADADLPVEVVLPAGMKNYPLFHLKATGSPALFQYTYRVQLGDPRSARNDPSVRYVFPFEQGTARLVMQGYNGSFSHQNTYALDFDMPVGTLVCAARGGVVVATKSDGTRGGLQHELEPEANQVTVYHADGTYAVYVHLKHLGVLVQIGDTVRVGDPLGLSGNTGYSSAPHLHFAVYLPSYLNAATVPVLFLGPNGTAIQAVQGMTYSSVR